MADDRIPECMVLEWARGYFKNWSYFLCGTAIRVCIGRAAIIGPRQAVLSAAVGDEWVLVRGRDALQ